MRARRLANWLPSATVSKLAQRQTIVFAVLTALCLVPIWGFRYFPSQDGPSHVYNALILKELGSSKMRYDEFFEVRTQLVPNLTSHLMLVALLHVFPPLIAEKVLLTCYVAAFALSFRFFVGSFAAERLPLASLGLLFVFNRCLLMGFYNYCFSIPLMWVLLGLCVRRRDCFRWPEAALMAVLLCGSYFTHLVGYLLTVGGSLWLLLTMAKPRWKSLLHGLTACIPSAVFCISYFAQRRDLGHGDFSGLLGFLGTWWREGFGINHLWHELSSLNNELFQPYEQTYLPIGLFLFLLFEFLLICTVAFRSVQKPSAETVPPVLPVAVLGFFVGATYFVLPDFIGQHGGFMQARVAFLPPMLWLACLKLPPPGILRHAALATCVALIAANVALMTAYARTANQDIREYTAGIDQIHANDTFVAAVTYRDLDKVHYLLHGGDYYSLARKSINLDNYEAHQPYFLVRYKTGSVPRGRALNEYIRRFDVDFVILWDDATHNIPANTISKYAECYRKGRLTILRRNEKPR